MARAQLGVAPAGSTDEVTLGWVRYEYPSYSTSVTATGDYDISLPTDVDVPMMELYEVHNPTDVPIVAMAPESVGLTTGLSRGIIIDAGRTAFLGFRYSPRADKWFFLSATVEQF